MKTATCQQRLNQLFNSLGLMDVQIADRLGVSKQTISTWRSGYRSPKRSMIQHIASTFNVDVAWLLGYDEQPTTNISITPEQLDLLTAYRAADQVGRQAAMMVLLANKKDSLSSKEA